MGREIRMVPPNWEHPRKKCEHSPWDGGCREAKAHGGMCFQPLHDRSYREAAQEWKDEFAAWERGERPSYCGEESRGLEFWEYSGAPPDREYYRPDWPEGSATWFQVYETVSEGCPITPPFATKAELVDWLCTNKDFWDKGPLTREQAQAFVGEGWAPSFVVQRGPEGVKMAEGMEIASAFPR